MEISAARKNEPGTPLRAVTATSLYDGHDAAINLIRRLLQAHGVEVIHLGHNRSVREIVAAAIQEDADAIAVSSYQGGHNEFFRYMVDTLRDRGAAHIRIFGGGGGTISPAEIAALEAYGVERIFHARDGMRLGLNPMIEEIVARVAAHRVGRPVPAEIRRDDPSALARVLSAIESGTCPVEVLELVRRPARSGKPPVPVVGMTGPGGAGKSSVTDELLSRYLRAFPAMRIAVLAIDPTRRRTGGALLGDRIRMNSLASERVYMRSLATRRGHRAVTARLADSVAALRAWGFDLVIVETVGIGQSDTEIVDVVDVPVYVMTGEYGAPSQLEKIDMLDYADLVVLNKFDRRGAEDALREVRKQWRRNRVDFDRPEDEIPVFPTVASQFNDAGVTKFFLELCRHLRAKLGLPAAAWTPAAGDFVSARATAKLIPDQRVRYLAEIAEQGRAANLAVEHRARAASRAQHFYESLRELQDPDLPEPLAAYRPAVPAVADSPLAGLRQAYDSSLREVGAEALDLLREWPARRAALGQPEFEYAVRGQPVRGANFTESLAGQPIPKIAPPPDRDWGGLLRFLLRENLPGAYPYTAGIYPYRQAAEEPTRMFAGEGAPERTNRRFHYLARGAGSVRLSTAFDSVTLYGEDPDPEPDNLGKVGNAGVSTATVDDIKKLYSGFDLCDPRTSVSMTINGPAPAVLAFFMNAAIDQQVERHLRGTGQWAEAGRRIADLYSGRARPRYAGELPAGNDGLGLGLLGVSGDALVDGETYARIRADVLAAVRGTVQADILKEDQAQNTCIFSTDFAMRMMGDVQAFFTANNVKNYYSVSISGYHMAEAGANPVTQLAFTLANGFTIIEAYLARGLAIDDFAPSLSFFFSNGMDPEYAVIGRVARRIWARALRERYGAGLRSQMLKYHIQTSGRSLHAREISFNDIRTTLQALYALFDNCNSLHTNAYDEAITTPTEESVRRAVAIQLVIMRELGVNYCQNPWQGSFLIERLTDMVEEAVYQEFEQLSARGGVLGAMEHTYQRARIQEESLRYERRKHDGTLPVIGVNTFLAPEGTDENLDTAPLVRATGEEQLAQIAALRLFQEQHREDAPAALARLQAVALAGDNVFAELMETVKHATLGQITHALYEAGGEYRRNM